MCELFVHLAIICSHLFTVHVKENIKEYLSVGSGELKCWFTKQEIRLEDIKQHSVGDLN